MPTKRSRVAVIIGAGPAGLTAAYELVTRTNILPIVIEKNNYVGGLAATLKYKGNLLDIGGHRFFSKSERVLKWWFNILPVENIETDRVTLSYQNKYHQLKTTGIPKAGRYKNIFLIRNRLSRIYYNGNLFPYPLTVNVITLKKLGILKSLKIIFSYLIQRLRPKPQEINLEDFLINRFGRELYQTFFKSYTEKVWGVPCNQINAGWGVQRIKGLTIGSLVKNGVRSLFTTNRSAVLETDIETSLISKFLYPKYGPGQLWAKVANEIKLKGGKILMHAEIVNIISRGTKITEVTMLKDGRSINFKADYFFSTMPISDLVTRMSTKAPKNIFGWAKNLAYRDFIIVGVLLKNIKLDKSENMLRDNWIYIHDPKVKVGRIQIFNNWSEALVKKHNTWWIGMEYFCSIGDAFWQLSDGDIIKLVKHELAVLDFANPKDFLDSKVYRVPKAYPAYIGTYKNFSKIKKYFNRFENLFLIGRNGMHKYNNQDHSMLTAMTAVDNIISGRKDKSNIWVVNTEGEHHESK